jgi:methionyl aminopeptidase
VKKKGYNYTGPLRPGKISPRAYVPEHIKRPDYANNGIPTEEIQSKLQKLTEMKSPEDI